MTKEELTVSQEKALRALAAAPNGLAEWKGTRGFAHNSWERMMKRLCEKGLVAPYVHGGFEITDAGRSRASLMEDR